MEDLLNIMKELAMLDSNYKEDQTLFSKKAQGKYICFFDDDDLPSNDYIKTIYSCLLKDPDVVELKGIITVKGRNPRLFVHSIQYTNWYERNGVYYRPPNHLNPIRRSIAIQFPYIDKSWGEDRDWSMSVYRSGLLKKEEKVGRPYYYYLSRS